MDEEALRRDPRFARDGRRGGRGPEAIDQRLERWVSRGRDLVDGVSGSRPGSRPPTGERRGPAGWNPARLGRWVEDRIDSLLEDDDEDWREPWQEPALRRPPEPGPPTGPPTAPYPATNPAADPSADRAADWSGERRPPQSTPAAGPARSPGARRSLEAISRRGATAPSANTAGPGEQAGGESWPDDDSFSIPRWRRPAPERPGDPLAPGAVPPATPQAGGRLLPRSNRRR